MSIIRTQGTGSSLLDATTAVAVAQSTTLTSEHCLQHEAAAVVPYVPDTAHAIHMHLSSTRSAQLSYQCCMRSASLPSTKLHQLCMGNQPNFQICGCFCQPSEVVIFTATSDALASIGWSNQWMQDIGLTQSVASKHTRGTQSAATGKVCSRLVWGWYSAQLVFPVCALWM